MKKGFTLIELLIVISIIGILAVALLPNILSAPATARDAGRKAALNSVVAALEQFKASNGAYPDNGGTLAAGVVGKKLSDISGIEKFFKGQSIPAGAPVTTAAGETVLELNNAVNSTDIVYCPLKTNTGGYSYVVAIRMEQPQGGANAYTAGKACTTADGTGIGGGATNWYFQVQ